MDRELKDKYVRDSKAYIYLTTDGKNVTDEYIEYYTAGWVGRNNCMNYYIACHCNASIFYAYCRARDQAHFWRLMDAIKCKGPKWEEIQILYRQGSLREAV